MQDSLHRPNCNVQREGTSFFRGISFLFTLNCVLACFIIAFFVLAGNTYAQQTVTCDTHTPSDPPTNEDALIALYCATDGDNWQSSRKTNWLTDEPLNNWAGVTATDAGTASDNNDDIVTSLVITRGYLHGQIPPEIGNLTSLEILNLSQNRHGTLQRYLSGPIPPEIGKLTNLQELILYRNDRLTGPLPRELGNLTNLTKLEVYDSGLTGSIPPEIGDMTSLVELELHDTQLTGSIPRELGKLGSLTRLLLDRNKLSGSIPPELGNIGNPDPSNPNSPSGFTGLLYLHDNQLSGPIPPELGRLDFAAELQFQNNRLSGPIPPELGEMTNLGRLLISNNQLTGPLPVELFSMETLHTLDLSNNRIDGEIPLPPEFANESTSVKAPLSHLYLQGNQLSGQIPPELSNLEQLRVLNLDYNQLTGSIPTEFNSLDMSYFSQLHLRGNQLTGSIPVGLAELYPSSLNSLTTDAVIDLSRNQLTGDIPAEFWEQKIGSFTTYLKELYLNDNQLTWSTLPTVAQLEGLTTLERLYLQNNMLSGTLPIGSATADPPTGLEALAAAPVGRSEGFKELALWGNPDLELSADMSDDLIKRVDRAVLRLLYDETGGENWTRRRGDGSAFRGYWTWFGTQAFVENDPFFDFAQLPGVTVNADGRVASLELSNNNLVGVIDNVAFDQLEGLQVLNLSNNHSLGGTLPVGLMDLRGLHTINIQCTRINTPSDADFQTWLGTINFTGSRCPSFSRPRPPAPPAPEPIDPSQDDMEELNVFYLETGGENWTDNTNWLSEDEPLSQWYGVTVNNEDRVTGLDLSGNGLSGSVPPSLGHLVSELETLNLVDNPMLTGMLPLSLMNLSELETLSIVGTGACAPDDAEFQQWLGAINFQGDVCVAEDDMDTGDSGGACAIAGAGNTSKSAVLNLFLVVFALSLVVFRKRR